MKSIKLSYHSCPITNQRMPNGTKTYNNFHISYCRYQSHYGSDTTALVLDGRVFFIMNGDHSDDLIRAAEDGGLVACIDLFIERLSQANRASEHRMGVGLDADPFDLQSTTNKLLSIEQIDALKEACKSIAYNL